MAAAAAAVTPQVVNIPDMSGNNYQVPGIIEAATPYTHSRLSAQSNGGMPTPARCTGFDNPAEMVVSCWMHATRD